MKRFLRVAQVLAVLVVGSVLSLSCILDSGGSSGSVQFTIKGSGDTARVYLATTQGALAPIGGDTDYLEVSLSSGVATVTIEGLPAGAEYNAFFGLGNRDNGWLETERYKVSDAFEISAGTNVEVDLGTLELTSAFGIDYSQQLMNKSLKGVVVSGVNVYTPTSNTLYWGGDVDSMTNISSLTAGHTANSISIGMVTGGSGTNVWVNTNLGIQPFNGGGFDTDFTSNLDTVSILDSGAHNNGSEDYVFFQRDGGLGGVESTSTPPSGWVNIDLSDVIQGQPIKDIVVRNEAGVGSQAYFATVLGSFFLDEAMLVPPGDSDFLDHATFFSVGTENIPVISLDFNSNSNFYYLGTEDGVWRSTDPAFAAITEIPGTSGRRYTDIVAASANNRWAARSPLYLLVSDAAGTAVQLEIPFNVLPDGVTGMAWDGGTLVIAADEGLISITPP